MAHVHAGKASGSSTASSSAATALLSLHNLASLPSRPPATKTPLRTAAGTPIPRSALQDLSVAGPPRATVRNSSPRTPASTPPPGTSCAMIATANPNDDERPRSVRAQASHAPTAQTSPATTVVAQGSTASASTQRAVTVTDRPVTGKRASIKSPTEPTIPAKRPPTSPRPASHHAASVSASGPTVATTTMATTERAQSAFLSDRATLARVPHARLQPAGASADETDSDVEMDNDATTPVADSNAIHCRGKAVGSTRTAMDTAAETMQPATSTTPPPPAAASALAPHQGRKTAPFSPMTQMPDSDTSVEATEGNAEATEGDAALHGSRHIRQQVKAGQAALRDLEEHVDNAQVKDYRQVCDAAAKKLEQTIGFVITGTSDTGCTTVCNRLVYPEGDGAYPLPRGSAPEIGSHIVFVLQPAQQSQYIVSLRFCASDERHSRLGQWPMGNDDQADMRALLEWRGAFPEHVGMPFETLSAMEYLHGVCESLREHTLAPLLDVVTITGPFAHGGLPVAFIDIPGDGRRVPNERIASICGQHVLVACSRRVIRDELLPIVKARFSEKTILLVNAFLANETDSQPERRQAARRTFHDTIQSTCGNYILGYNGGSSGGGDPDYGDTMENMQRLFASLDNLRHSCEVLLANREVSRERLSEWVDDIVCSVQRKALGEFTAGISNAVAFGNMATAGPVAAPTLKKSLKRVVDMVNAETDKALVVTVDGNADGGSAAVGADSATGTPASDTAEIGDSTSTSTHGNAITTDAVAAGATIDDGAAAASDEADAAEYEGQPNVSRLAQFLAGVIHDFYSTPGNDRSQTLLAGELAKAVSFLPGEWLNNALTAIVNLAYNNVFKKLTRTANKNHFVQPGNKKALQRTAALVASVTAAPGTTAYVANAIAQVDDHVQRDDEDVQCDDEADDEATVHVATAPASASASSATGSDSDSPPPGQGGTAHAHAQADDLPDLEGLPAALLGHAQNLVREHVHTALKAALAQLGTALAARLPMHEPPGNVAGWLHYTQPVARKACSQTVTCGRRVIRKLLAELKTAVAHTVTDSTEEPDAGIRAILERARAVRSSLTHHARTEGGVLLERVLKEGAHFGLLPAAEALIQEVLERGSAAPDPALAQTTQMTRMPRFTAVDAPQLLRTEQPEYPAGLLRLRLPDTAEGSPELRYNQHDLDAVQKAMYPGGDTASYKPTAAGLTRYTANAPQWPIFRVAATPAELKDIQPLADIRFCNLSETLVVPAALEEAALALQRKVAAAARNERGAAQADDAEGGQQPVARFLVLVVEGTGAASPAPPSSSFASPSAASVAAAQADRNVAVQLLAAAHTVARDLFSAPYWWNLPGGVAGAVEYSRLALRPEECPVAKCLHYAQRLFDLLSVHTWTALENTRAARVVSQVLPLSGAEYGHLLHFLESRESKPDMAEWVAQLSRLSGRAVRPEHAEELGEVLKGARAWSDIAAVLLPKAARVALQHLRQPKLVEFGCQQSLRVLRSDPVLFNTHVASRMFSPAVLCGAEVPAHGPSKAKLSPVTAALRATVCRVTAAAPRRAQAQPLQLAAEENEGEQDVGEALATATATAPMSPPRQAPPVLLRALMVGFKEKCATKMGEAQG